MAGVHARIDARRDDQRLCARKRRRKHVDLRATPMAPMWIGIAAKLVAVDAGKQDDFARTAASRESSSNVRDAVAVEVEPACDARAKLVLGRSFDVDED